MNRIKSYYVTNRQHAKRELIIFFTIVFIIMYGLGALGMVFQTEIEKIFGPISNRNLFVMMLIYAPTISGLILTVLYEGRDGLVALFKRGVLFTKPLWWLIAIFIIPVTLLVFGLFTYLTGIESNSFNWNLFTGTFPLIIFSFNIFTDAGPIGEELGWRGYALPRLLQFYSPVMATAILSVFWTLFHLVAFFASGTNQFGMSFIWFSLFCISLCYIMTWLYINNGGNWIASGLIIHYMINSFALSGAVKVGPGLSISLSIVVIIIFLLKGFQKGHSNT
jgi:membrane protease YdiL (CAAX protease family)